MRKPGLMISPGVGQGPYVERVDEEKVDALIAADPGATAGVSAPKVSGWNVIAIQSSR